MLYFYSILKNINNVATKNHNNNNNNNDNADYYLYLYSCIQMFRLLLVVKEISHFVSKKKKK